MHPEIEKLIDLALADGQVTDKERNVILKKAAEHGVDADEVEMVLEAKLHQRLANNKFSNKVEEIKKCPSCGNVISGLTKTCSCGYVINTGNIQEVKSLESAIDILENLIIEIRSLKENPNKLMEERISAKIEKEIRFINVRYGDNQIVRKLISELEELSNSAIFEIKKKRRRKKIFSTTLILIIVAIVGFFSYTIISFKTPEQEFNIAVNELYKDEIKEYKKTEDYKKDSIFFFNSFLSFGPQINYEKIKLEYPSPFKYYVLTRRMNIQEDIVKAKKYTDTCIALYPNFAPIYYRKTFINDLELNYSLNLINKAIKLDPNNRLIYINRRGQIYANFSKFDSALNDLLESTNSNNTNFNNDYMIFNCYMGLNSSIAYYKFNELKSKYPKEFMNEKNTNPQFYLIEEFIKQLGVK